MKESTKTLLEVVDGLHDWDSGQVYGGGGTVYRSSDVCCVCGLERHYFSDSQNGIDGRYSFTLAGESISLRAASELSC